MTARQIAMVTMAAMGAAFFYALLAEDLVTLDETQRSNVPWGLVGLYICAMALGGAAAGFVFAGLFGRAGVTGWVRAILGGVLVALFTGLVGSAVAQVPQMLSEGMSAENLVAIGFGIFVVPLAITGFPGFLVIWGGLTLLAHLWCKRARSAQPAVD